MRQETFVKLIRVPQYTVYGESPHNMGETCLGLWSGIKVLSGQCKPTKKIVRVCFGDGMENIFPHGACAFTLLEESNE